jgi:hypothetical protein
MALTVGDGLMLTSAQWQLASTLRIAVGQGKPDNAVVYVPLLVKQVQVLAKVVEEALGD